MGLGRYPSGSEQSNYFSVNGLNVTTNSFWFSQQGQRIELYQEEGTGFPNHYIYKQTDLLALGAALEKLDPRLSVAKLNDLIKAGSSEMKASYEGVLDAVRKMVQGPGIKATAVGDVGDNADSRADYHRNLAALQENTTFKALAGRVTLSASAASAIDAKSDFGKFLSLHDLSPITLSTSDAQAQAALLKARSDEASTWQSQYSDKWLQDRSAMQGWVMYANREDIGAIGNTTVIRSEPLDTRINFEDAITGKTIKINPMSADTSQMRNFKFGDDKGNGPEGPAANSAMYEVAA